MQSGCGAEVLRSTTPRAGSAAATSAGVFGPLGIDGGWTGSGMPSPRVVEVAITGRKVA